LSENRRLVTILFADLSGSTSLAERLDAEDLREFLTSYFATLSGQIQRYGGTVDKYIGDAVMAVFGAPVAHEDDPERAINAALAILAAFGHLNDDLQNRYDVRSGLRIGINTGEVVAGLLSGGIEGAYTVVGDTVNTAQRFEAAAPPGGILVSAPTWRLTRQAFEFEPLAPLELRGKAEPQPAYRVIRRRFAEIDVATTPLIGRDSELGQLEAAMADARSGKGRLLHVVGEAGVGKSRLVREFRAGLESRFAQVVARCASFEVDTPYALVGRVLRSVLQIAPGVGEAVARSSIEQLLHTIQGSVDARDTELLLDVLGYGERSTFDPQSKQRVLLGLMRRVLIRHVAEEPMLLVAEDLHWSDSASTAVLTDLSGEIPSSYCMLISTSRPGWDAPWHADRIDVRALPEVGARTVVELAFGQAVDDNLAQTVLARTAGNPFFIEEVVRGLFESDALEERSGVLTVASGRSVRVPATIQEVVGAHLDRLPPSAKRVLQPAAVHGRTFWEDVVERVVGNSSVEGHLATLMHESLIVRQPEQVERTYAFRHALIQEVAYQRQLQSQRRAYHGAIGTALEVLYPDRLDELIGELAFHFGRSDDQAKAVSWLVRAGDRARGLFANQEALGYFSSALERAADGDGELDTAAILERIGDVQHLVGLYDDAISTFHDAVTRVMAPTRVTLARFQRKIGTALRIKGVYAEAEAAFAEALRLIGDYPDPESATIRLQIGQLYWRRGEYSKAEKTLAQAVAIASQVGNEVVLAEGLKQLGNIPLHTGEPRESLAYFRRSQAIYEQLEDIAGIGAIRMNLGTAYGMMGQWDECLAELSASLELHTRIGDRWHIGLVYNNMGEAYRERGDLSEAIAAFQQAFSIYSEIGDAAHAALTLLGMGMARVDSGQVQAGRADLLQAETQFSALDRTMYMPDIYRFLASAELAMGNLTEAERQAARSIDFARQAQARHQEAMTQRVMGEIALARGRVADARELLEASRRTLVEVGEAGELTRTEAVLERLKG
jgi:class 3 adenylate cyclase/tetratricopeptide (TPR) repeat protein